MEKTEVERKAQLSLILGIVGLFVAQLVLGILAIVFANQAREMAQRAGMPEPSDARTGRVLGIVAICIFVVGLLVALFMFTFMWGRLSPRWE